MKRILIGILIFVLYLACVIAGAFALHFSGSRFALFCTILGVLGAAAIAFTVWYISSVLTGHKGEAGSDSVYLDALLRDADRKLRTSRLRAKSLRSAQIIYILGEENSGKTQTVLESGLDAELLAGNLFQDGAVAPTQLANVWLAGSFVIVEAGGALLAQPALWRRVVKATRPGRFGSLFSKRAHQPARAVVLCVSVERLPSPTDPAYDKEQIRTSAQTINERLRQLSQTLGISIPVYVLFTKLDTFHVTHFADYVSRLTAEEVKTPLGTLLGTIETGSGLYAERASNLIGTHLDELIFALSEFRLDVLSRGGELKILASAYEFPRDLRKRREVIRDFLVELTRPSQLGINTFLRGFFFSGLSKIAVEGVPADPSPQHRPAPLDPSATIVFSLGPEKIQQPQMQSRRPSIKQVPQWVFLPHLFSKLLLNDQSALEVSRASAQAILLKRALVGCLCSCIFIYLGLLSISFLNNRDLAQEVINAASISISAVSPSQRASILDLQTLDKLGSLLRRLDTYHKDGPPQMYRWGLYAGDALYPIACHAYANKFRVLLLGPAQANILTQLRAAQPPPPPGADYNLTYNALKAYLITTSNSEKSMTDFLPPVLTRSWAGASTPSPEIGLGQIQFETYAVILTEQNSCMATIGGQPDLAIVDHARDYLSRFGGAQHIYGNMLANANSRASAVHFNDNPDYPNSARFIIDPYQVPGAFTKAGFTFMQNAIQHPETYYKADEWVLGPNAGPSIDPATLSSQIQKLYTADYLAQWRAYLKAGRFVAFQNWNDADAKLTLLDSPSSPILEFFSLISVNTGVPAPEIANAFQAPQSIVPPTNPPDRFKAPSNEPYINALVGLATAVKAMAQNSLTANDPAAAIPVQQAAALADQATVTLRNMFNPDPDGKMDVVSFNRLEDPINSINVLAAGQIKKGPNAAGASFCAQANNILEKFPFNRKAALEASPDEVAAIFSPGQGEFAKFTSKQSQLVTFQNGQWMANPATSVPVNPAFVHFLNSAQKVAGALFPSGGNQPSLTFSLKESKTVPDAVLTIDDTPVTAGQTVVFHWNSSPGSKIIFTSGQKPNTIATGPWSVFHLGLDASHPSPNSILPSVLSNGRSTETVPFEIEGPGVLLLDPHFMDQLHCNSTIAKP